MAKVTKVNDYAVKFSFASANPTFLEQMARWRPPPYAPAHYMKQFHPKYADKAKIEEMMKAEGFDAWSDFFNSRGWDYRDTADADCPVLSAWKVVNETTAIYAWLIPVDSHSLFNSGIRALA